MASSSAAAQFLLLLLLLPVVISNEAKDPRPKPLRRRRREWIFPPAKLMENVDYTQKPYIAKIRSDKDKQTLVEYYLTGPGANKPPTNLFVVDHDTGFVRITDVVDRERHPFFNLTGVAKYADGTLAELDIPLVVTILDMNDNAPRFELQSGSVSEGSKEGTFVMQIEGRDDDQPGTINSQISYSIISQEPEGSGHVFRLDEKTGKLYVKEATLDRETVDCYTLVVQGADLGGAPGGLKGTGTVEIRVLDINDNIPTLEQSEYRGSVDENVHNVVVSRLKVLDLDLEHTDNWRAVFGIAKGNEDNLFTIETDEKTNEGILKLIKPLDFEEVQILELAVFIRNVAPFTRGEAVMLDVGVRVGEGEPLAPAVGPGGGASDLSAGLHQEATLNAGGSTEGYRISIAVNNVPEDPAFIPHVKEIPVSEDPSDQPEDGIIAVFAAVDPDTGKPAQNVRYAKASDPDNWFTVDEDTAEIKLKKQPDRESPFVVNGTYVAKIVAISKETPSATATGSIRIKVADSNDHCPTLTSTHGSLCADRNTVYITALDGDASPNAAPFTFTIVPEASEGRWDIQVINETTAALRSQENLWPGVYRLQLMLADAQGRSCPADQVFALHVCACVHSDICHAGADKRATSSSALSAAAIGMLLLAAALLLLVPLLLLSCQCGGANTIFPDQFTDLPFEAKEHLMSYHTEGKGKDEELPLKSVPAMLKPETGASANIKGVDSVIIETYQGSAFSRFRGSREMVDSGFGLSGHFLRHGDTRRDLLEHVALPDAFLRDYYAQGAAWAAPLQDGLLEFSFEGRGSPAGSVSSCSLLDAQDDPHFLADLDMKFKTLAEICSPPENPSPPLTWRVASASEHAEQRWARPHREAAGRPETLNSPLVASRSSASAVSSSPPWMKRPAAEAITVAHSSELGQSAALIARPQTLLLQQQPVYSTILQPVQYVVQPQLQSVLLLADEAPGADYPGLLVVQGAKNSPPPPPPPPIQGSASGIIVQGSEYTTGPTVVIPVSPGAAPSFVSLQGCKIMVPNPGGKASFVRPPVANKSSPGVAERDPGPSQGTLQRSTMLVRRGANSSSLGAAAFPTNGER